MELTEKEVWEIYPDFWGRNVWSGKKRRAKPYIGVGKGWWPLIAEVMKVIKEECETHDIDIFKTDVKEKYASLRIYINHGTDKVWDAIDHAEKQSLVTCEDCGSKGELVIINGWHRTLCKKCIKT